MKKQTAKEAAKDKLREKMAKKRKNMHHKTKSNPQKNVNTL